MRSTSLGCVAVSVMVLAFCGNTALAARSQEVLNKLLTQQSIIQVSDDVPEPRWYPQFTVTFNETTKIFFTKHTEGMWYYDALNNKEALYRANGNGDRYCGSVHPFTQTACAHIVTGGKRYLVFPDLGECCMCCTAEQGCGIVSPSWLNGASYQGVVETQGVQAYKWRQDGLQPNYWYATADAAQIPLELDQMPNDKQTFWPSSFLPGPPPDSVFELPDYCSPRCPLTSVCTIAALASRW